MTREPASEDNGKPKRKPRRVRPEDSILARHPHLGSEADHERAKAMSLDFTTIAPGTKVLLPWRHSTDDGEVHAWLQAGTSRVHMRAGCSICRGYTASAATSLAAHAAKLAEPATAVVTPRWSRPARGESCGGCAPTAPTPGAPGSRLGRWTATAARAARDSRRSLATP